MIKNRRVFSLVAIALAVGVVFGGMAVSNGASGRWHCENDYDGIWRGDPSGNDHDGTCKVRDSATCPDHDYEILIYESDHVTGSICGNGYTEHRRLVKGEDEAGVLEHAGWVVTYPEGLCSERCALNANNTTAAAGRALKGMTGLVSKAYFQTYGAGSYQICYYGDANALYRFISGEWVRIAGGGGGVVCASASGDGAFAAFTE